MRCLKTGYTGTGNWDSVLADVVDKGRGVGEGAGRSDQRVADTLLKDKVRWMAAIRRLCWRTRLIEA